MRKRKNSSNTAVFVYAVSMASGLDAIGLKRLIILCSVDLYEEISDAVTSANAKDSGKFCNC